MPTLFHLNGPAGVGKSTLAQRYADEHPGVLNLDIDRLVAMIGGWEERFFETLAPARTLAVAMAETHLRGGCNVVMPQLVTSLDEGTRFQEAAAAAGGTYLEVALIVDVDEQITRFRRRAPRSQVDQHLPTIIDSTGGNAVLARIHRHFCEYLSERPDARRIHTDRRTCDVTYRDLLEVLTPDY